VTDLHVILPLAEHCTNHSVLQLSLFQPPLPALAGNVGDMLATCWQQGKMLPIFAPTGQFRRHGFYCVGTLLCRIFPTQTDQRQMTKKRALSNSHVTARQPKKRGPKEHDKQHLENASSRRRLPCPVASIAVPSPPPPPPSCCPRICSCRRCLHRHAASITVPLPSPCCHSHHCQCHANAMPMPPLPPCRAMLLPPSPLPLCS
jgi:hypothetical protein